MFPVIFVVVSFKEPFVTRKRPQNTILELIDRTKNQVRALDKANYNRITKIIMNEEVDGDPNTPPITLSSNAAAPPARNGAAAVGPAEELVRSLSINSHSSTVSDDSISESSSTGQQVQEIREQEGPFIFSKVINSWLYDKGYFYIKSHFGVK